MKGRFLWLLPLVSVVVGCSVLSQNDPPPRITLQPTPSLTQVLPALALTPNNGGQAVEFVTFSTESSGPVAALAFVPDGSELLAVYGIESVLRRWRVRDGTLLRTLDVGPVGMAAVAFDNQARILAVGAGSTEPAVQAGYAADVVAARIWDTQSGEVVLDKREYGGYATDVALSPDGQWLALAYPDGYSVWSVDTGASSMSYAVGSTEVWPVPSISALAFGPAGTWLAHSNDSGWVKIVEWAPDVSGLGHTLQYDDIDETPLTLAIDASRHWLASVTTEHLTVWDLQSRLRRLVLKQPLGHSELASLAFNSDGSLLAVGTANGWQIWSVGETKLVLAGDHPAYAVAFNPDGRLFAWGDTEGVIHLWGVPAP